MSEQTQEDQILFSNANWSAFVMAVTLLSVFNSLLNLLGLPRASMTVLGAFNLGISLILWVDLFYMRRKAPDRHTFWVDQYGWLALLGSFPFMRVLRLLWFWLVLRKEGKRPRDLLARISLNRNAGGTLLGVLFVVLVVFQFAVVFILFYEAPAPGGNIKTVGDAFWWAFVTVSTVGYGDKFPVTNGGRTVGFVLIIVGIALFSVITGTLTQWFLGRRRLIGAKSAADREQKENAAPEEVTLEDIKRLIEQQARAYQLGVDDLNARVGELEARIADSRQDSPRTPGD